MAIQYYIQAEKVNDKERNKDSTGFAAFGKNEIKSLFCFRKSPNFGTANKK